jgi:hypothetical protein
MASDGEAPTRPAPHRPSQDPAANPAEWRRTVGASVHLRVEQYAKAIGGLKKIGHSQFEQLVVDALYRCAFMNLVGPKRTRPSQIRKVLLRVEEEAAAAEKHLERLRDALAKLEPEHRERLDRRLDLLSKIAGLIEKRPPSFYSLSGVSSMARYEADELFGKKDKGGRPDMFVFSVLIKGLVQAFQEAAGRPAKVAWSAYRERYEGDFLDFVEEILPLALEVACQPQRPMPYPESVFARAKYIHKLTKSKREGAASTVSKT